jgi:hypothetical protein
MLVQSGALTAACVAVPADGYASWCEGIFDNGLTMPGTGPLVRVETGETVSGVRSAASLRRGAAARVCPHDFSVFPPAGAGSADQARGAVPGPGLPEGRFTEEHPMAGPLSTVTGLQ